MAHPLRLSHGVRTIHNALPQTQSLSRGVPRLYSQLRSSRHRSISRPLPPTYHPNKIQAAISKISVRYNSDSSSPKPLTDRSATAEEDAKIAEQNRLRREQEPAYQLSFTCKPCGERSSHRVSKHGYHRGTVLIQCPSCKNRHVISDNLGIFFEKGKTLDDLLQERGQAITRGALQGDMEFWEDGTVTKREDGTVTKGEEGK
ncbi:DNL zinc finger-domain-containing protein [Aspergillus recurvatus]